MKKYRKSGKLHRFYDWTAGCIAVTDDEIDYVYQNTAGVTPIRILQQSCSIYRSGFEGCRTGL